MAANGSKFSAELEAALEHGVDVKGRRIFLHGDVGEDTIALAIRGMYLLADLTDKHIELFVTSYGGELDEAFALHDVTRTICVPVHTVALGKCQSAAPLLVACGHRGQRWAAVHTTFMLHDAWMGSIEGENPANLQIAAEQAKQQMKRMAELLAKYSRKDKRHWTRLFASKTDRFFDAEQAQEWGIIDEIWDEKG